MDFLDEDARPRFLFQSRSQPSASSFSDEIHHEKPSKLFLSILLSISTILLSLSLFFLEIEPFKSLLIWISLSLFLGPLAPSALTGGHTRVGHGPIVDFHVDNQEIEPEAKKKPHKTRSSIYNNSNNNNNKSQEFNAGSVPAIDNSNRSRESISKEKRAEVLEEKEWSEEDIEMLKKQMVKNPVGKPKRWEVIAEAFNGRHKTESVIKKAKELGQKKTDDSDSYELFLKNRKSSDAKIKDSNVEPSAAAAMKNGGENGKVNSGSNGGWSGGDDMALLNALKAFPKDAPMRWEKITEAVPGKTKAGCMKRVGELKRDFRNSKAGNEN